MTDPDLEGGIRAGFDTELCRHYEIERHSAAADFLGGKIPRSLRNAQRFGEARQQTPAFAVLPAAVSKNLDAENRVIRPTWRSGSTAQRQPILASRQPQIRP